MHAEFDDVAAWTADIALELEPEYRVPAACRGSGSPPMLRWFLDRLAIGRDTVMLDAGAGVGGPAAFAAVETAVRPVLSEPESGACRASRRLFDLPVVQAASQLPFRNHAFDVVWALGVLCTVPDHAGLLAELHRVLRRDGRLGLLVYVARQKLSEHPAGNHFPTEDALRTTIESAGFRITHSSWLSQFAAPSSTWQEQAERVESELERRFGHHPGWRAAQHQAAVMGRLIAGGELAGCMLVARPAS